MLAPAHGADAGSMPGLAGCPLASRPAPAAALDNHRLAALQLIFVIATAAETYAAWLDAPLTLAALPEGRAMTPYAGDRLPAAPAELRRRRHPEVTARRPPRPRPSASETQR